MMYHKNVFLILSNDFCKQFVKNSIGILLVITYTKLHFLFPCYGVL